MKMSMDTKGGAVLFFQFNFPLKSLVFFKKREIAIRGPHQAGNPDAAN